MPIQVVNWDLVKMLEAFFWSKGAIIPSTVIDCQYELCSPDTTISPVLAVDNDGNITWHGKAGSGSQTFWVDANYTRTMFFRTTDWIDASPNNELYIQIDSDALWGKVTFWNLDIAFDVYDNEAHTFEVTQIATFYSQVNFDDNIVVQGNITVGGTVDGVDVSAHVADANAHHAAMSISTDLGNNLLGLSTQQLTLDTQAANKIFSGPTTGAAAAPTFRSMVAADVADHSHTAAAQGGDYPWADITGFATTTEIADTTLTEGAGTSTLVARGDHVHALSVSIAPTWTGKHTFTPASDAADVLLVNTHGGTAVFTVDTTNSKIITPKIGAAADLTISPTGDVVFDPTGNDLLPTTGYDLNIGSLQKKFLALHAAELWVETLVAQNTIATIGGRILVGPTTTLVEDCAAGDTHIHVKHNELASGDTVYLEANGSVEFMAVTSGASGSAGNYSYNVTRNLDSSGANAWYAGDAVFNTGAANEGFIDIYSVHGVKAATEYGPTIVGNVRVNTDYSNWLTHWALGNLYGLYNYGTNNVYGFAAGRYGTGYSWVSVDASNGFRVMNNDTERFRVTIDGNMYIKNSAGTAVITLDNAGAADITGTLTAGGGDVSLGSAGLTFVQDDDDVNKILWKNSTRTVATIGAGSDNTLYLVANGDRTAILNGSVHIAASSSATLFTTYSLVISSSSGEFTFGKFTMPSTSSTLAILDASGYFKIAAGLSIGSTTNSPGSGEIWSTADLRVGGGVYVGAIDADPSANDLWTKGDIRVGGGLYVGSTGTDPAADALVVDGNATISGNAYLASGAAVGSSSNDPGTGLWVSGTVTTAIHAKFGDVAPVVICSNSPQIFFNGYYSSGWKRLTAGSAAQIFFDYASTDQLIFRTSANSTADSAITLIDGIIIGSSGGVAFPSIGTTGTAGNAYLDSGSSNSLKRSTSSQRYKKDITEFDKHFNSEFIYGLVPKSYKSAVDGDVDGWLFGFVAEDVEKICDTMITRDDRGRADWVQYSMLVVPIIVELQRLRQVLADNNIKF